MAVPGAAAPLGVLLLLPLLAAAASGSSAWTCALATERAILAQDALREHFWNETSGLWDETLWWQNACSLEVMSHHALFAANDSLRQRVEADVANLYAKTSNMSRGGPTLTGYYDDEEWWALGWLRAWELTGNASYANRTRIIFEHQIDAAWNESSCGGGLMWQGFIYSENRFGNPYKGAITNELFLMITAKMAVLGPPADRGHYADWAQRAWAWFRSTGMIGEKSLINDGLDTFAGHEDICRNNNQTAWSYNQGVILGGLAYMWELTAEDSLLETAASIVNATLVHLVHSDKPGEIGHDVLMEPCEGRWMDYQECSQDALQFKGVFVRYLGMLLDLAHRLPAAVGPLGGESQLQRYKSFVQTNADSIWNNAACTLGAPVGVGEPLTALPVFGTSWLLPCGTFPGGWTAAAQTSALDVLVIQQQISCSGKNRSQSPNNKDQDDGDQGGEGGGSAPDSPRGLPQYYLNSN
jgi:predicted alpha-1,6-mannanase (GH76 family)